MAELAAAVKEHEALSAEWRKGADKLDRAKMAAHLETLKLKLLELSFLPTRDEEANVKELTLSRDTLEIGAQFAVLTEDIPGFERYMAQLQTYYHDYQANLPESPFQFQLLGLNLLCLLSQNRVAEFHTELERLPANKVASDVYIKHPVSLEQYIMEGSYNKVVLAKGNVPAQSYKYFIDILMVTVRDEIASCLEKAYADISCADAARMLSISSGEMAGYAKERKWQVTNGRLRFRGADGEAEEQGVPSIQLANMAITYAREMEQIV